MFPRQDHSPWLDCCIYCWVQSQIGKIVGKTKRWIPILQAYIKLIVFHCSLMHIHRYGATCMYLYLQNTVISSDKYTLSSPPDRILGNLFIIFCIISVYFRFVDNFVHSDKLIMGELLVCIYHFSQFILKIPSCLINT